MIIEVLNFKLQFICFKRPCAVCFDCFSVHQLWARPWWLYISHQTKREWERQRHIVNAFEVRMRDVSLFTSLPSWSELSAQDDSAERMNVVAVKCKRKNIIHRPDHLHRPKRCRPAKYFIYTIYLALLRLLYFLLLPGICYTTLSLRVTCNWRKKSAATRHWVTGCWIAIIFLSLRVSFDNECRQLRLRLRYCQLHSMHLFLSLFCAWKLTTKNLRTLTVQSSSYELCTSANFIASAHTEPETTESVHVFDIGGNVCALAYAIGTQHGSVPLTNCIVVFTR